MDQNDPVGTRLNWASRLQAIAQNGLAYSNNDYDTERYQAVRQVASEILASGLSFGPEQISAIFQQDAGYATPKVDVRGAAFQEGKLLMVREATDGFWSLPGGWADVGEAPAAAISREILDESGFHTQPIKLLALFDRARHPHVPAFPFHVYKCFFLCRILSGEARASTETTDVGFFDANELPPLSISRVTPGQIVRCFAHHRNPSLPTEFD